MDRLGGFALGFGTATIIGVSLFAMALYDGRIVRGDAMQDVSGYLPKVVREMPYKRVGNDQIGGIIARAE